VAVQPDIPGADAVADQRRSQLRDALSVGTLVIAAPMIVLDIPWWQVVVGFVLMHFVVSLVFVYSLICTSTVTVPFCSRG
jgi:hypothetical protein